MSKLGTTHRRTARSQGMGMLCLMTLAAAPTAVEAQNRSSYSPVSTFDAYGNARSSYRNRREIGTFQSTAQRQAVRGFQNQGRRQNRRGGINPFVLPSDIRRFAPPPATTSSNQLFPGGRGAQQSQESYGEYGGFKRRLSTEERRGDVAAALTRRRLLIEATTLNAPIHRALGRNSVGFALRSPVSQTPSDAAPTLDDAAPPLEIVDRLQQTVEDAYARTRTEAWSWFRAGEYRRAARFFETASMLRPNDDEALVGEMASYWSLGAIHTAAAVLRELVRRNRNPFTLDVNLATAYADTRTAQRMRIDARLQAAPDDVDPQLAAIDVVMLWYLGDRGEARLTAGRIARRSDVRTYADWPTMMDQPDATPPTEGSIP